MSADPALPDERSAHLLNAALVPGDPGLAAWRTWLAATDLDRLGEPARRLLPLVYTNLSRTARDEASLAVARRCQMQAWVATQRLLNDARPLLAELLRRGIDFRLFRGGALAGGAYRDWVSRPMADLDLLVSLPDVPAELAQQAAQARVMLHQHAFAECPGAEADLRTARDDVDVAGLAVPALAPTEGLFLTCVLGYRANLRGTYRHAHWVADAHALLTRRGADIDPARLVELAHTRDLQGTLALALTYVIVRHGAPAPGLLDRLAALRPAAVERLEQAAAGLPGRFAARLGLFACRQLRRLRAG